MSTASRGLGSGAGGRAGQGWEGSAVDAGGRAAATGGGPGLRRERTGIERGVEAHHGEVGMQFWCRRMRTQATATHEAALFEKERAARTAEETCIFVFRV